MEIKYKVKYIRKADLKKAIRPREGITDFGNETQKDRTVSSWTKKQR
jgi:hypothetical protein